jgi:hypothetical protein
MKLIHYTELPWLLLDRNYCSMHLHILLKELTAQIISHEFMLHMYIWPNFYLLVSEKGTFQIYT